MTDNVQIVPPPVQATPETAPGNNGGEAKPETLSLTTGQLNERLERAKHTAVTALLKELGIEDTEVLKTVITEHKTLKTASQTEAEKLSAAATEAQTKLTAEATARQTAEARVKELEDLRVADRVDAAIKEVCMTPAIRADHPQDVVKLIREGDMTGVVNDAGEVDPVKVKALVEQAKKDRPGWFKTGGVGSPSNRDGVAPEAMAAEKQRSIRELQENLKHKF